MRPQVVVLPLLRAALNAHVGDIGLEAPVYDRGRTGVSVVSQLPDVDHRMLPLLVVTRSGGVRNSNGLPQPVVRLTVISADGPVEAEELYEDALDALYASVSDQTVVPGAGHLQSISEAQGATQAPSPLPDTWSVEGSVRLSISPVRV